MRTLADFAVDDFLKRVDALGRVLWVGDEHEMHTKRVLVDEGLAMGGCALGTS